MTHITKMIYVSLIIFALNSCALRPITSQYDYQKNNVENVNLDKLGDGKILIYNGADGLHKVDNTARINVWVDEKPMGQVRAKEYVIVDLKTDTYDFKLLHIDMAKFRSNHNVQIDETTKVIRIEPTIISNDLTITNQLPSKFDKFKYVEIR